MDFSEYMITTNAINLPIISPKPGSSATITAHLFPSSTMLEDGERDRYYIGSLHRSRTLASYSDGELNQLANDRHLPLIELTLVRAIERMYRTGQWMNNQIWTPQIFPRI